MNGTLYFDNSGSAGSELWKSDGTTAGTIMVKDINPGPLGSDLAFPVNVNGTLFFAANDGNGGRELWKSDGTTAGTLRVKDIYPGQSNSNPSMLMNVNGTVFFAAVDATNGYEAWRSDGTAAGTRLIADIASGSLSSSPKSFTLAGGYLFFSADDGAAGRELWAVSLNADAYLHAPARAGVAPGGVAAIPVQYGNHGLVPAGALTLTATLDPALSYVGDSSGITPTISGPTIMWRLLGGEGAFALRVRAPAAAFGTRYPVMIVLSAASDMHPADNRAQVEVMIARQVYLPVVRR